jgi:hypothetical protein
MEKIMARWGILTSWEDAWKGKEDGHRGAVVQVAIQVPRVGAAAFARAAAAGTRARRRFCPRIYGDAAAAARCAAMGELDR